MDDLLILNGKLVNEGAVFESDIYIKNGRIEQIGRDLSSKSAKIILQIDGKVILPGMIDSHVHFREPGLTHKGCILTESKAAVAGGITSYFEMPNTNPPTTTVDLLNRKLEAASRNSYANYSFFFGATNINYDEIQKLDVSRSCGIKVFVGSSTGNLIVNDINALRNIFKNSPLLIAAHCEDDEIIKNNESKFRKQFGNNIHLSCHPLIRSEDACFKATSFAINLAREYNSRLHVLHISTAKELNLFQNNETNIKNKLITSETCTHYLAFSDQDYRDKGSLIKCNPSIKSENDRKSLIDGVISGQIDTIATDHAPHTLAEKEKPYLECPSGIAQIQYALLSLLEHYHNDIFSLPLIVEKICHTPANIYNVKDRGFIREGFWGDLVVVNLDVPYVAENNSNLHFCKWSPYSGKEFSSKIESTIVSGKLVFHKGQFLGSPGGLCLEFTRISS